jgi:D-serine deaminase-like pyridoxal phosphate-dependent protein
MTADHPLENAPGASLDIPTSVETPSLVVDLDRVEANLDDMAAFAEEHAIALVPHVKTHRTPEFAALQMKSGATALCVAKLSEAEEFARCGFRSFVMAYPIVGEEKFERAKRLVRQGVDIRLTTDDLRQGQLLAAAFATDGLTADVAIKVDTGFHRVGVEPPRAVEMAVALARLEGVRVRGFIAHEGHAAGADDDCGVHDLSLDSGEQMVWAANQARAAGVPVDTVSVGSTATAKHTPLVVGITEVRPGIYPFNDYGQLLRGTVGLDRCAARVVTTVVSSAAPDRAVIDAGSKSLGQDLLAIWFASGAAGHGLVIGEPGWSLFKLSEEHGWMRWEGDGAPRPLTVGQRLQILPNHICSAFHVLGESVVVRQGAVVATWVATARGCSK